MPTSARTPTKTSQYVEWDGEMRRSYNIFPFTHPWKYTVPPRDDVGIVPYNETFGASHSSNLPRKAGGKRKVR